MKTYETIREQQIPLGLEATSPVTALATASDSSTTTKKPRAVGRVDKRERLLRRPEVQRDTGLSRSGLYRKIAANEFPKAIHLSENSVAWVESEVAAWIARQIAASRGNAVKRSKKGVRGPA